MATASPSMKRSATSSGSAGHCSRRAHQPRALARRFPRVDLAAGQGHAQQVLVDGVGLLLAAHAEAALLQVGLLVGARLRVFLLDFADRRDDAVIATRLHRQVETHLVVAHAGATVGDGLGAEVPGPRERGSDDQVAVADQQRILRLVALARTHERLDETGPDRRAPVDGGVRRHAEFGGALLDVRTLLRIHAAGIGEHGVHVPAAFPEVWHAETGVEAAGEGQDDVLAFGIGNRGLGIRGSRFP
jgi:hypothetical protein